MRLLLDTHALLWFLQNDRKLSPPASAAILDSRNERWLSPCSLLEIALKVRMGKLTLHVPFGSLFPSQLAANDIHLLPLEAQHIEPLTTLPLHRRDPFDRVIAATVLYEGMQLVSIDAAFDFYGVRRLW